MSLFDGCSSCLAGQSNDAQPPAMLLDSEDDDETISPDEWAQLSEYPVRARANIVLKGRPTGRKGSIEGRLHAQSSIALCEGSIALLKADSTANFFVQTVGQDEV